MKNALLLLLFALVGINSLTFAQTTSPGKEVSPVEFEKLAAKKGYVLLDVRTPEEFAEGHLKNAQNIDYKGEGFADRIGQLDKTKKYLVYCQVGGRSAFAASLMRKNGFKEVKELEGGIEAWQEAKLPVSK